MTPQEAIEFLNRTKAGCNILRDKQYFNNLYQPRTADYINTHTSNILVNK